MGWYNGFGVELNQHLKCHFGLSRASLVRIILGRMGHGISGFKENGLKREALVYDFGIRPGGIDSTTAMSGHISRLRFNNVKLNERPSDQAILIVYLSMMGLSLIFVEVTATELKVRRGTLSTSTLRSPRSRDCNSPHTL